MSYYEPFPGNAAACGSLIEKNYQEKLFAVINDDDSVLMIARTEEAAEKLHKELLAIYKE